MICWISINMLRWWPVSEAINPPTLKVSPVAFGWSKRTKKTTTWHLMVKAPSFLPRTNHPPIDRFDLSRDRVGMRKAIDDVALWNMRARDVMHLGRHFCWCWNIMDSCWKQKRHSGWINQFHIDPLGLEYLYTSYLYLHLAWECMKSHEMRISIGQSRNTFHNIWSSLAFNPKQFNQTKFKRGTYLFQWWLACVMVTRWN